MKKIAIAMLALLLIGCEDIDCVGCDDSDGFLKGRADVQLLTLEDGTQCAVLIGHRRGALDCNWK
jgi:hypothetical protein